jgi:hypothetical protein
VNAASALPNDTDEQWRWRHSRKSSPRRIGFDVPSVRDTTPPPERRDDPPAVGDYQLHAMAPMMPDF